MIDFELPAELAALRDRVSRFITDKIVPYENDPRQGPHGAEEPLRRELNALAREAGLLSPHGPKEYGGLGLDHRSMAVVFEVAGGPMRSPYDPAFNPGMTPRIQVIGNAIENTINSLERAGNAYISDGNPSVVARPATGTAATAPPAKK